MDESECSGRSNDVFFLFRFCGRHRLECSGRSDDVFFFICARVHWPAWAVYD
jgi:hypothetical protein